MWKNFNPVYGAGIRTRDLQNMSDFPKPLEQGSRPDYLKLFDKVTLYPAKLLNDLPIWADRRAGLERPLEFVWCVTWAYGNK